MTPVSSHTTDEVTPERRENVAIAVLAAGGGSRFGGSVPKPLAPLAGRSLVAHALRAAERSGLRPLVLVVGSRGGEVAANVSPSVEVVSNPRWRDGISTSLRVALELLDERVNVNAVIVGLADQPLVGPEAYRRLAAAYDDGATLAAASYGGQRANPVLIARSLWDSALTLRGDVGARALMSDHPVTDVPCDGTGEATDVDTPTDLAELEARCRSKTASE